LQSVALNWPNEQRLSDAAAALDKWRGGANEQRLSDAAAALDKWRGGAWRQINPVELNRLSVGV
jgi:hypothetical protein